jgi:hypothetical protein
MRTCLLKHQGGPIDGRVTERHLSRDKLFALLDRLKDADEPIDKDSYILTGFDGIAFYWKHIPPGNDGRFLFR